MRVPARIGEGLSGLSKANTSERGVALKEVLNQVASDLAVISTALTAFKADIDAATAGLSAADIRTLVMALTMPAPVDMLQESIDA